MRANHPSAGFTLIELLVVTPFVIMIVAIMVGLVVNLTGEALVAREQSHASYTAQSALDRIEQDIRVSKEILATSGTLPAPQGRNSNFTGTSAFATPASYLVLSHYATTQGPHGTARSLVYYANQPNPCGATQEHNQVMYIQIIYYVDGSTLKRRTVMPSYSSGDVCNTPWQRNSCKTGLNTANQCRASDEVIAENVSAITFAYYENPGDTTPLSGPAVDTSTVLTTLTVSKPIAGRDISASSVMRASAIGIE